WTHRSVLKAVPRKKDSVVPVRPREASRRQSLRKVTSHRRRALYRGSKCNRHSAAAGNDEERAMNIFEALRQSHELQRDLASQILKTSGESSERENLFDNYKTVLTAHA